MTSDEVKCGSGTVIALPKTTGYLGEGIGEMPGTVRCFVATTVARLSLDLLIQTKKMIGVGIRRDGDINVKAPKFPGSLVPGTEHLVLALPLLPLPSTSNVPWSLVD